MIVYGDRRPHLVALIVPHPDFARAYARRHGLPDALKTLVEDEGFQKAMARKRAAGQPGALGR